MVRQRLIREHLFKRHLVVVQLRPSVAPRSASPCAHLPPRAHVACRYSPDARPDATAQYDYSILRSDVYAVAAALNFSTDVHLVGHDHGAALGWYAAADIGGTKSPILSYSALSVPHLDAFNAGLFGPNADIQQQVASQVLAARPVPDPPTWCL